MNIVATNLRFPADDYEKIKLLAFSEGKSVAEVIRQAVNQYRERKLSGRAQVDLAEKFRKAAIKINVPVVDLVKEGRRFE